MLRRCLTLGLPLGLVALLLVASSGVRSDLALAVLAIVVIGASVEIAYTTTQKTTRYGASGMVAGMAAMMAAMGTGLAIGYASGMVWELGWANLTGVVAGFAHGLGMGRRYGPMAALDGAGGGVMGGLMGPMLGVMLLYLPASLVLTAFLMLALQAIFSLGAVYLVAEAAGQAGSSTILRRVGWVLGAEYLRGPLEETVCCPPEASTARRPRKVKARKAPASRPLSAPARGWIGLAVATITGALAVLLVAGGFGGGTTARVDPSAAGSAVQATLAQDGAQELTMSLHYPRYEPRLMEVKAGTPVRLTLQAIGEPG